MTQGEMSYVLYAQEELEESDSISLEIGHMKDTTVPCMDWVGKDVLKTWIKDQLDRWWMPQDPSTPSPNLQKLWHPPNPWNLDAILNEVRTEEVCVAQLTEISFPSDSVKWSRSVMSES